MPGTAVWVPFLVGGFGESTVNAVEILPTRRPVGSGANERVDELDALPDFDQTYLHRRIQRRRLQPEDPAGSVEEDRVAERLRSRQQDEQSALGGEGVESLHKRPLDRAGYPLTGRHAEPARKSRDVRSTRQFEEGERMAVTLHDDLVANNIIQRPREVLKQQRSCVLVPKSVDRQLRQAHKDVIADATPDRTHDRDPLG